MELQMKAKTITECVNMQVTRGNLPISRDAILWIGIKSWKAVIGIWQEGRNLGFAWFVLHTTWYTCKLHSCNSIRMLPVYQLDVG